MKFMRMTPRPPALDTYAPDAGETLAVGLGLACALVVGGAFVLALTTTSRPTAADLRATEPAVVALRDVETAMFAADASASRAIVDAPNGSASTGAGANASFDGAVSAP